MGRAPCSFRLSTGFARSAGLGVVTSGPGKSRIPEFRVGVDLPPGAILSFETMPESIARFLALRDKYGLPLWLGERVENLNEWFRECVALVEQQLPGQYQRVANTDPDGGPEAQDLKPAS